MGASPLAQLLPALIGGHSTEPYWVAIPIIGLALLLRVMRVRNRGGGPFGGSRGRRSGGWGNGPTDEPQQQWDIRKPAQPAEPTGPADGQADRPAGDGVPGDGVPGDGASGEEHNAPSDL